MGKGDKKTRKGKITRGSYGKSRPKNPDKQASVPALEQPKKPE
ncbi:30S ribosomal protein THX [Spirosoma sp. KNUC1025]|nr:30S ribosomal protein THX [Spirosoma sp. KNUC1025]